MSFFVRSMICRRKNLRLIGVFQIVPVPTPFYLLIKCLLLVLGSIINCCHQGQSVGNRQIKGPHCVEKNIDYDVVGRVSRGMCKAVFLSCCQSSAMDQYCKLGVQAAMYVIVGYFEFYIYLTSLFYKFFLLYKNFCSFLPKHCSRMLST